MITKLRLAIIAFALATVSHAQFSQNFESGTGLPSGWSVINGGTANTWSIATTATAHSGTKVVKLATDTAPQGDYLVTQQVNVIAGVSDRLAFWAKTDYVFGARYLKVMVSTTGPALATNFTELGSSRVIDSWRIIVMDLSAYVGQSIHLAIAANAADMPNTFIDDVSVDRLIPTLNSDCTGVYDLTTQEPMLLNGQNPANYTISYYTSLESANSGTGAISDPQNLSISIGGGLTIYIFARIYNNTNATYTINYFPLSSSAVYFNFDYWYDSLSAFTSGGGGLNSTLQWYNQDGILDGETDYQLSTFLYPNSWEFYVVYTDETGCSVTSNTVYKMQLWNDSITIPFLTGQITTTSQSVLDNDMIPFGLDPLNTYLTADGSWPAGITLNDNGTINVDASTPGGTYYMQYNFYSYTGNIMYNSTAGVTLVIPLQSDAIILNPFLDTNGNNVQDNGEPDYQYGAFTYNVNSEAPHTLSSSSGECWLVDPNPANVYNVSYAIPAANSYCGAQFTIATASYTNLTIPTGSGLVTLNFPINTVSCIDANVSLLSNIQPRPGISYTNTILYKNKGTETISGSIAFIKDATTNIINVSQSGTVNTPNGFTYDYVNLLPGEERNIIVTLQTPALPIVALGQVLTNSVTISPTDGNAADNSSTLSQVLVGSYDPNDKTESHGGEIVHATFTETDYLTYTIQFENTGTADALDIRVNDLLDAVLDETTVRMISASHAYTLDREASDLNWYFNDINLPPNGRGNIVFQVKPKLGYAIGDIIPNVANIYFDTNPAIVTEPSLTEFVDVLGTQDFAVSGISFYPNPVKNNLTITTSSAIDGVEVISAVGQKIFNQQVYGSATSVDFSQFENGLYFVKVTSGTREKIFKVVKE